MPSGVPVPQLQSPPPPQPPSTSLLSTISLCFLRLYNATLWSMQLTCCTILLILVHCQPLFDLRMSSMYSERCVVSWDSHPLHNLCSALSQTCKFNGMTFIILKWLNVSACCIKLPTLAHFGLCSTPIHIPMGLFPAPPPPLSPATSKVIR